MFREVMFQGRPLSALLQELRPRRKELANCHLDPDLREESLQRQQGWRPLFGQCGASQGHLERQNVRPGDLFIFYGWFRRTVRRDEHLVYAPDQPDLHVIFGWLQIGKVIPQPTVGKVPAWAAYHPHIRFSHELDKNNALYISSPELRLPGLRVGMPGGGTFAKFGPALCLTDLEKGSRSVWRLPGWFQPRKGRRPLTYHEKRGHWEPDGRDVLLKTVSPGQEFVLFCEDYPEATAWLSSLIATWSARDFFGDRENRMGV